MLLYHILYLSSPPLVQTIPHSTACMHESTHTHTYTPPRPKLKENPEEEEKEGGFLVKVIGFFMGRRSRQYVWTL